MRSIVAVVVGLTMGFLVFFHSIHLFGESTNGFLWGILCGLITAGVLIWLIAPKRNWRWPLVAFIIAFLLILSSWLGVEFMYPNSELAYMTGGLSILEFVILFVIGGASFIKWKKAQQGEPD